MNNEELLKLIYSAKQKNPKAQTQLINKYWVDVFSFVLMKVKDENDTDELTVNIFSKVLNKLDLFDAQFQFKTWVLTIAQNTIIDYWRKKGKDQACITDSLYEQQDEFAQSPEELLISEEREDELLNIVSSMDDNYRDIIRLRFFEEKSIKEISEELNISISNTKVRIMRAKKVLEQLLKEKEFTI